MKLGDGKSGRIINVNKKNLTEGRRFYRHTVNHMKPLLINLKDKESNMNSYISWYKQKTKEILRPSNDYIREFKYDKNMEKFVTIEDNFNKPSAVFVSDYKKKYKKILFEGNTADKTSLMAKQDIVNFTNSKGIPLKGVLYYPANFISEKKYPMVVNIYEVQSRTSNRYTQPYYGTQSGYDLRSLLERGYFVYLPDIVYDARGTGVSALDCVNKGLDAISNHPNIDRSKVGLTGHSHGAYETNYIATHSERFTTYISGAGNSDIIRSYFSYNYNFTSPFYWQFESEQYEMYTAFSKSKELYLRNSPILNVEKVNAPILLWAGKKDENIAWDQVMEFYIGLRRNKKEVIALFYPNQGHGVGVNTKESIDLYKRVLEWWDYFLKGKKNVPWIDKQIRKDAF